MRRKSLGGGTGGDDDLPEGDRLLTDLALAGGEVEALQMAGIIPAAAETALVELSVMAESAAPALASCLLGSCSMRHFEQVALECLN